MEEQIKPVAISNRAIDLAREGVQIHEEDSPEYAVCAALLRAAETVQQLQQRNDMLLALLKDSQQVCRDAFGFWNNDQDSKVGKILRALSGDLKGYRNDIDSINAIIAESDRQS